MNQKTKIGLEIVQAAVLLGIIGDLLFRGASAGLNVFIWFLLFAVVLAAITVRRKPRHWNSQALALHGALIFFALTYAWRDSAELKVFNFLAILTILAVQIVPALGIKTRIAGSIHYVVAGAWAGVSVAFAPLLLVAEDIKWKTVAKPGLSKHIAAIAKGLAIALPIFLIFGALFMAADAAFEGFVRNTFRVDANELVINSLIIGVLSWVVAGYLRASLFDVNGFQADSILASKPTEGKTPVPSVTLHISEEPIKETEPKKKEITKEDKKKWDWRTFDNSILPEFFTLGAVETGIILGLINLLFLSFVIIQLPYLFGGMDLVQNTPDFKLAEYARRGFGELIAVASLVLPVLLVSHWLLRRDKPINEKLFRIFAGIQIGLLFIIMASAAQRLLLLTGSLGYGLTTDRLYPIVFIILLATVFLWFCVTVLRGFRQQFAWGTLWIALFMLGTLHVLNPDDFIVRTNARLMQEGRTFDSLYNSSLSADAVPALVEAMPFMSPPKRQEAFKELHYEHCHANDGTDIRSWNWSRSVARSLLEEMPEIARRACPVVSKIFD